MRAGLAFTTIANMATWDFWARPSSLSVEEGDLPLVDEDPANCPLDARRRISAAVTTASRQLLDAEVHTYMGKPS